MDLHWVIFALPCYQQRYVLLSFFSYSLLSFVGQSISLLLSLQQSTPSSLLEAWILRIRM
jgi:hypothetical protein